MKIKYVIYYKDVIKRLIFFVEDVKLGDRNTEFWPWFYYLNKPLCFSKFQLPYLENECFGSHDPWKVKNRSKICVNYCKALAVFKMLTVYYLV